MERVVALGYSRMWEARRLWVLVANRWADILRSCSGVRVGSTAVVVVGVSLSLSGINVESQCRVPNWRSQGGTCLAGTIVCQT